MNKLTKKFSILLASVAMATGVGLVGSAKTAKADTETLTVSSFSTSGDPRTASLTGVDVSWTKASGTNAIVTTYSEMRIYAKHQMTFTPKTGFKINSIVATATNNSYASALAGGSLTGATKSVSSTTVTITPTTGTDAIVITNSAQSRIKQFVIDYSASASETADAFLTAVAAIPSLDELTVADKATVVKAREEYGILTDTLKAQEDVVAALATLEAAEAKMAELEAAAAEEEDVKAAAAVDELINALGEVDLTKASQVKAARDAYNALSENAKTKVTALATLEAAEATIDTLQAAEVDALINAIGEITDYSKAAQIKEARAAYDALSENGKTKVTALATLEAAEEAILEYAPAEVTYEFAKMSGFADWDSGYSKREDTTTYPDAKLVLAAANKQSSTITDYPVTKGQPVEVIMTDGSTLDSVEFTFAQWGSKAQTATLHYSTDGGATYTSTGVTSTTFAIPTTEVAEGTNAVKVTFNNSSNQVGIVSCKVVKHRDAATTADKFLAAVNALPAVDALALTDKTAVEAARTEYGYLTDELKAQEDVVAALKTLEAAEAKIAELEKAAQDEADATAAAEVDALINAIGEVTDYSKAEQIKAARDAYEALNDNAKTKVTALETLVAAETALAEYAPLVSELVAGDLGLDNAAELSTYTVNKITYTFTKGTATGSLSPKYYNSDKTARCYTNNHLIIQGSTEVGTITSITLTTKKWGNVTVSPASEVSTADPYVITVGSATNTVVISFNNTTNITNISVAYTKATTEQVAANEFIAKWNVYSADYCTNVNDEAKRAEILALIAEYEALDADVKAIVDANIDLTGTAMARSIEYAKNHIEFLNNTATGEDSTGTILSAVTESGASTIAIVAALVLLTFVGYVVISKKKLVK